MTVFGAACSKPNRCFAVLAALSLLTGLALPAYALSPLGRAVQDTVCEDAATVWDQISELRLRGDYEAAIVMLDDVIVQHVGREEILRHAYNHQVFTLILMRDNARVDAKAVEALDRFPDLQAPPPAFPDRMNTIYDNLRRQMYGTLQIVTNPGQSEVYLNGEYRGKTMLNIPLIRTGNYDLLITRTGYVDHVDTLTIGPNQTIVQEISLSKQRNARWWVWRAGAAAVAVAGIVIALMPGSEDSEPQQPLPGPPDPPN